MKFEEVLPALREGKKVRRKSWGRVHSFIIIKDDSLVDDYHCNVGIYAYDLKADDWEIVKETKNVKLRDLTEEEYDLWIENNCAKHEDSCRGCPFQKVQCDNHESVNDAWYLNKDLYSDKFLDQEIEIEVEEND